MKIVDFAEHVVMAALALVGAQTRQRDPACDFVAGAFDASGEIRLVWVDGQWYDASTGEPRSAVMFGDEVLTGDEAYGKLTLGPPSPSL